MATKTYTALTPIEHDGERVDEGGKLTLSDEQAAPLLALRAVEVRGGRKAADKPAGADDGAAADGAAAADGSGTATDGDGAPA